MSESELDNAGEVIAYSVRVPCRSCGRPYALPRGAAPAPSGFGPCCQPELFEQRGRILDLPVELELELVDDERERPPTPDPLDVLCAGCRDRRAAGVLSPPGVALCVDCADELLEHWLAWLVDPSHEWWPGEDVFGSCRVVVEGWRSVELEGGTVRA